MGLYPFDGNETGFLLVRNGDGGDSEFAFVSEIVPSYRFSGYFRCKY